MEGSPDNGRWWIQAHLTLELYVHNDVMLFKVEKEVCRGSKAWRDRRLEGIEGNDSLSLYIRLFMIIGWACFPIHPDNSHHAPGGRERKSCHSRISSLAAITAFWSDASETGEDCPRGFGRGRSPYIRSDSGFRPCYEARAFPLERKTTTKWER